MPFSNRSSLSRRELLAAGSAAFMVVPRHVLGGAGYTAPSDKVTIATIGMGRQGMAITMEPGIYLEGWGGIRIEDTVLVTETGCEILTPTSKELRVV